MVQGAGRAIVWSSFNKPLELSGSAAKLEFGYGPDRARYIQRKSSGSTVLTLYFDKHYEKVSAGGVTEHRYYIYAAGRAVALYTESGDGSKKTRYLHQDHLGSTEVITDELGNEIERLGFTAFGKHTVYGALTDGVVQPLVTTTRGFTGHELLGEFDLIHMNGRVYDPHTGRFLSADPQVQFPGNMQSYNRYSYVHNNPLSYTDPSGFGIWSKVKKAVKRVVKNDWARLGAGIVAANVVSPYVAGYFGLLSGSSTVSAVANGVAGGLALGGITAGNATGALRGGLQGGAFGFVGHASVLDGLRSSVPGGGSLLHGAVGGTFQTMAGESFREGFLGAAATKFSNTNIFPATNNAILGSVRSVVAGGLGAQLGGGKFLNGATTGAFSYLFNDAFGKIQMRRVGDSLYPVRVYECATAECVARGANIDLTDSGSQAFLRASDAKALADLGTAASLVVMKTPVSVLGNVAARTSLTADVARTILTGNPALMLPALTGRFAQGVAETTLGVTNAATINRIGVSTGFLIEQVIDSYE
jgi:RHS repeat-associated protein